MNNHFRDIAKKTKFHQLEVAIFGTTDALTISLSKGRACHVDGVCLRLSTTHSIAFESGHCPSVLENSASNALYCVSMRAKICDEK